MSPRLQNNNEDRNDCDYELRPLKSPGPEDDDNDDVDDDVEDDRETKVPHLRSQNHRRFRRRRGIHDAEFLYTSAQERAVVRRLDLYLVSSLAVLYMLSFLDRSNIGNAKIAGMTEDLNISGDRYEILLEAFYFTYISFQWLTLCWTAFAAHKFISFIVVGWGIVASLQALATKWGSMMILRVLLGIFEAAFGPGVPVFLSLFYRREELALRTGLFIAAAPLATAYAGFLAYGIVSIPSSIAPWRLLFILEGFPTVVAGICAYYFIPDSPSDAAFLNSDQKKIARRRLLVVRDDDDMDEDDDKELMMVDEEGLGVRWIEVGRAFCDAGNWITAMIFFFANISFASLPVFLPTILNEMDLGKNHTAARAQMFSVPPYLFALVIIVLTTWLSDHYRSRSIPLCILCSISALGYLILALTGMLHKSLSELPSEIAELESPDTWLKAHIPASSILPSAQSSMVGMSYAGIMLAAGTIFSIVSLVITWNGNNSETRSGRGTGMVILQVFGQCGPLVGMKLYPAKDGPEYVQGSLVCAGCMGIVGVLVILQRWRLKKENARREMQEKMELAMDGVRPKRRFRYIL